MKKKLKSMMEKSSFAAYRLTENGSLEIQGRGHKIVENYFLFDGEHYYFKNQFVQLSSTEQEKDNLLFAITDTKLLIPQENDDYLYIARNYMAHKNLLAVVLYYYNGLLYYTIISGKGSGRVHPVYLPYSKEAFSFCFHFAVDAIASVDPKKAETFYTTLIQKREEVNAAMAKH